MLGKSFRLNLFGCHAQQDLFSDALFHAVAENAEQASEGTDVIPGSLVVFSWRIFCGIWFVLPRQLNQKKFEGT